MHTVPEHTSLFLCFIHYLELSHRKSSSSGSRGMQGISSPASRDSISCPLVSPLPAQPKRQADEHLGELVAQNSIPPWRCNLLLL
ncbi:hypothetical protein N7510_006144 [Penicillium lagena]|uniref:uncharacterized protein n=1 Tax=Penicillium lagena TaxID=94218 RepID=UPI002541A2DF|nr:uncharacterized protein N7510_006144 [Penicillium lagena]KAJ5612950.1 hypothetical protein N7510_006144 [Penicillium lagena]